MNRPRVWVRKTRHGQCSTDAEEVRLSYHAARAPDWHGELLAPVDDDGSTLLNLFSGDSTEPVEVCIDDEWVPLPAPTPTMVDDTFTSVHHWRLPQGFTGDAVEVRTRSRGRPWDVGFIRRSRR